MQQLKPSVTQTFYDREWLQQLTWLHSDNIPWAIGLPLKVDPMTVYPPCFVYFQTKFSTIEMFERRIRISPYPELDAEAVIDLLEHLELEPIRRGIYPWSEA